MNKKSWKHIYSGVKNLYEHAVTVLFALIEVSVILQIVARFSPSIQLPWTEELARMLLVFTTVLGVVCVSRRGEHLGAYFLRDLSKGRLKGVLYLCGSIATLIFLVALASGALTMYLSVGAAPATTTMPWITRGMIYAALFFSAMVMAVYGVRDLIHSIQVLLGKREITKKGTSSPFPEED